MTRRNSVLFVLLIALFALTSACSTPPAQSQAVASKPEPAVSQTDPLPPLAAVPLFKGDKTQATGSLSPLKRGTAHEARRGSDRPAQEVAENRPAQKPEFLPEPAPPPPFIEPEPPKPVAPPKPPEPRIVKFTIPAGTTLFVRMIESINSETDRAGQKYDAELEAPVEAGADVIIPAGADIQVKLVDVKSAGRVTGRSEIRVQLDYIVVHGKDYTLESSVYEERSESRTTDTAKKAGIGAAIGAAIGAISAGAKGAVIGGTVGAGSGVGVQVITKGPQVRVDSEALLEFRLEQPLTIEKIVKEM